MAALYAFTGFESIANAAEEMDEPERTLPRAIPLAILAVGAVYLLAVVVAMLLGSGKVVGSDQPVTLAAAIENDAVPHDRHHRSFGIDVRHQRGRDRLARPGCGRRCRTTGILPSTACLRRTGSASRMLAFGITASLTLAFPLALRFDTVNLYRPRGDRPIHSVHHRADRP